MCPMQPMSTHMHEVDGESVFCHGDADDALSIIEGVGTLRRFAKSQDVFERRLDRSPRPLRYHALMLLHHFDCADLLYCNKWQ